MRRKLAVVFKKETLLVCGGRSCIWQAFVPYSQATGLPYCSPPAREYPSPSAAYRHRDTDSRRRQVTKLPKPCPQYPPFTLENGIVRFFSIMDYGVSGTAIHQNTGALECRSCLWSYLIDGFETYNEENVILFLASYPQAVLASMPEPLAANAAMTDIVT